MWNAHAKDALEERLQYMVCDKQIDLASARRQIATDWIAAYKKYFHADNPCKCDMVPYDPIAILANCSAR